MQVVRLRRKGDTARAKTAYQDFLTLWKDADPDIPIFKQAKAENAKITMNAANFRAPIANSRVVA